MDEAQEAPIAETAVVDATAVPEPATSQPPLRWREVVALLFLVVLSDWIIYRGDGFSGYALFFVVAPALLFFGYYRPQVGLTTLVVKGMLLLLAAKLLWSGSVLLVVLGFCLTIAFSMALAGQRPYVLAATVFASQIVRTGLDAIAFYVRRIRGTGSRFASAPWLSIILPTLALAAFGLIFVVANPDVLAFASARVSRILTDVRDWLGHFSYSELFFWLIVAWLGAGLLRSPKAWHASPEDARATRAATSARSPMYAAYRNTLVTLIVLFGAYLVFEFQSLWLRDFPDGFYYAGYAHAGAAWLTVALGLATAILSTIFSRSIFRDPRLVVLRRLAWIWSLENLLLALAVYNRLYIYIGFNGMTRLRIVGIFGITTVVVGFGLVLWKIAHQRTFVWLVHRQLWALALAIYLYALTPVDAIAVRANVQRILAGDPKPSVQIVVQPIDSAGVVFLEPLLDCRDATIREGVAAMLAAREELAEGRAVRREALGWKAYQAADARALRWYRANRTRWSAYRDLSARRQAVTKFSTYARQWY